MPRRLRIRVAIGLCLLVAGLAAAFVGPVIVVQLAPPFTLTDPGQMADYMIAQTHLAQTSNSIMLSGLAVALLGFLLAFVTWIQWLVRPDTT
jgi:hypothetical protein